MSPSFNLVDEPWLPCLFAGEPQPRDVSVREALARAPAIRKLVDASPLVTVALHRLLLAILHRVFGPESEEEWVAMWETGHFDQSRLDVYFSQCGARFDLFDPEHPFYQTPGLEDVKPTTIAKLAHEFSSGNNPLLFEHSLDAAPVGMRPSSAARRLVAQHAFAMGGLISRRPGDPVSAESSHLVKAAVLLATGESLFRTLMLNMVKVNGPAGDPFPFDPSLDAPAWEQDPPRAATRDLRGYLDLLTWQSRRVLLIPFEDGGLTVSRVVIMDGYRFPPTLRMVQREPMVAFTKRTKVAANQDPEPPVGFRPERALWRDSLALIRNGEGGGRSPLTLRFVGGLKEADYLDEGEAYTLAAFGISSDRAKVFLWRCEELPLPLAYLGNDDLLSILGAGIKAAEEAGRGLRSAVWRVAQKVLAPEGNADSTRVRAFTESLNPERPYWPALDVPFRRFMGELATGYQRDQGQEAMQGWAGAIRTSAGEAFEQAARAVETSSRGYRAAAEARSRFYGLLAGALAAMRAEDQQAEEGSA